MNQESALDLHKILLPQEDASFIEGANWALKLAGLSSTVKTKKEAIETLTALYITLLDAKKTTEAAILLWGIDEIFDPRPRSVQKIWTALDRESKILIPGAGDQGKSYTPSAWTVLWWTHDPAWTSVKILSVTATHASANVMATIKSFFEYSVLPLAGRVIDTAIDLGDGNKRSSISMVSIPQGGDVKGRLRGFHPVRRPTPHPIFGQKSRIGVFIDEGEDVPNGLWEGLENILSSETRGDSNHLKIFSGANPKKRDSAFAQRCEYPGGWQKFDIEESQEWTGPEALGSWKVVRLDAAKSENVIERREVYAGMMTYDGYMNYLRKGANDPSYATFARGAWPEASAEFLITPLDYFNDSRGTLMFSSDVVPIASLDPAFAEGGDSAILTTGRYGTAIGFSPVGGDYIQYPIPHKAIQIETQFAVQKDLQPIMAQSVINYLRTLGVRPEWFIMDMSGNALGLHDMIRMQYGSILGQQWGESATDKKIASEDSLTAEERFSGIVTEMAFAFAIWLEHGYIKFSPMMDVTKLINQSTSRKYYFRNTLLRAEDKNAFKAVSGGSSPDEYDSAIMMVHLARMRDSGLAQTVPDAKIVQSMRSDANMMGQSSDMDSLGFISII